jgi:hypothetical protein
MVGYSLTDYVFVDSWRLTCFADIIRQNYETLEFAVVSGLDVMTTSTFGKQAATKFLRMVVEDVNTSFLVNRPT